MHPLIERNARRALEAGDKAIREYLYSGISNDYVLSLRTTTAGYASAYINEVAGSSSTLSRKFAADPGATGKFTWNIVAGLGNASCYSLQSATAAGHYLTASPDLHVSVQPNDGSDVFARRATWCAHTGRANGVGLESQAAKGRYLRHYGGKLYAAANGGTNAFDATRLFTEDSTWNLDWPNPITQTPIDLRYTNDDAARKILGAPSDATQIDGAVGFREYSSDQFGKSRMVYKSGGEAHYVRGAILTRYVQMGAHKGYGLPSSDEIPITGGAVSHFDLGTGASIYSNGQAGTRAIFGAIRGWYLHLGAEKSYLGFPVGEEEYGKDLTTQRFQHGRIEFTPSTGKIRDIRS